MKVLLIWPYGACDGLTMPLCYLYMLPILRREGHTAEIADCALHDIAPDSDAFRTLLDTFQPDVVGVSAWTIHRDDATAALNVVKTHRPQAITIAGGPHFTSMANYSVTQDKGVIDFVFKGEAEQTLPQFLRIVAEKGRNAVADLCTVKGLCFVDRFGLVHENAGAIPANLDDLGQPDYESVNLREYLKRGYHYRTSHNAQAPILTTRGCPYTCDFCAAPFLNGRKVRQHSVPYLEQLIGDLWRDHDIRWFNIIDDNFTFDVAYAKRVCRMIIKNHDRWPGIILATPNGIRVEKTDEELFGLMYAAGWRRVIVAPESGSQRMVNRMAKHLDLTIIYDKVRQAQRAGLEVEAYFILGHPGEDDASVDETEAFIREMKFDDISVHIFQPLPGTPIHDQMITQGTLTHDLRIRNYGEVSWVPEGWTADKLRKAVNHLHAVAREIHGAPYQVRA